tara:strand:+ start:3295 stop:3885 length:591 start_codon:yes stop_codon:yes gene_type:complete
MRKITLVFTLVVILSVLTAFANIITVPIVNTPPVNQLVSYPLELKKLKIETNKIELKAKDHSAFLNAIGFRESSNNYKAVNRLGYLGKYQFGKKTLRAIGISVSKEEFLDSPMIQEEAMHLLLEHNRKNLKRFIKKYNNTTVHGIYVTESGILAAAHLGGAGNIRKWFRKGEDFKDGYGTTITSYMVKFQGYQLEF